MRNYLFPGLFIWLFLLSGCTTNIQHITGWVQCPVDYAFEAPYNETWEATLAAALEYSPVDVLDKKDGYLSTEIATVDGKEMEGLEHALFGQTYKFTYAIRIFPQGKRSTRVSTRVKLYFEQFMGASRREDHIERVENYLRQKLYRKICNRLFPSGNGHCSHGFSSGTPQVRSSTSALRKKSSPKKHFNKKVQTAQKMLKKYGYDPGPADGLMGRKTRTALRQYQQDNGIQVSGKLEKETYDMLTGEYYSESHSENTLNTLVSDSAAPSQPEDNIRTVPVRQESSSRPTTKQHEKRVSDEKLSKIKGKSITTESVDLLQEQDLYSTNIVGTIPKGTVLHVLSQDGEYYKVRYKGKEGYIYAEFVRKN